MHTHTQTERCNLLTYRASLSFLYCFLLSTRKGEHEKPFCQKASRCPHPIPRAHTHTYKTRSRREKGNQREKRGTTKYSIANMVI